jgi:hypothetical protein
VIQLLTIPLFPWFGAGIALSKNRIATDLALRASNPGEGEIFRTCPGRRWGPLSFLSNGYQISFPAVKRPWSGVDHLPPSCAEAKERVQLYLYSPSGPSWAVIRWTLPFTTLWLTMGLSTQRRNDDVMFTMSDMITMASWLWWLIQYDGDSARCVVYRSVAKKHRHRCTILASEGEVSRNYVSC